MTSAAAPADAPRKAGRREWLGLAVLALPAMLIAMDMTVLYLAVPQLSADLAPDSSQLLWILDVYGFLVAGCLITMGTIGDRIGRRRLLLIGAAAFGVASMLAAWSDSAGMLIATRALLGVAGATLMPSTLALIRSMFPDPAQRTAAIAVWMTSFTLGMTLGPLVGGAVLERWWWGAVFLLAVPPMVLLLAVGPALLPEHRDPAPGRLDLVSAALSIVATISFVYGVKEIAKDGAGAIPFVALLLGVALGVVFARRQRRLTDPMLDLKLFSDRAFSASLGTLTLTLFAMSGVFFFLSQYMQMVLGLTPFQAGLWTLPQAGAMVVVAALTPGLVQRVRPAYVMAGGLVVGAVGFLLFLGLDGTDDLWLLVTGSVVLSIGVGPMTIMGVDMIVGAAPPERAGAASAISETNQEFGMAIGVAVLGSVGTAVYRGTLQDTLPAGVPAESAEAARDTLGGALEAAAALPGTAGPELLAAARQAFTQGLHVNTVIAAVLVFVAAALVAGLLRQVTPRSAEEAETAGEPTGKTGEDGDGPGTAPAEVAESAAAVDTAVAEPAGKTTRAETV
ncbi:MFS transporter [Streptomyces ficellus]|uniref:MFS transporter n=1 Tax=Streptomyces ficellus TaxID=1977088 RepID=A0A6I6FGJ3_9ACTN|nr:MFS transporter [Streptomyces ficellus]QGV82454.1 MFS transporter [Streptomyces ficellus]